MPLHFSSAPEEEPFLFVDNFVDHTLLIFVNDPKQQNPCNFIILGSESRSDRWKPGLRGIKPADLTPVTATAIFPVEGSTQHLFRGLSPAEKIRYLKDAPGYHPLLSWYSEPDRLRLSKHSVPIYTINITATSVSSTALTQSTSVVRSVGNRKS